MTFGDIQLWDRLADCDMTATFGDIGATFSAITVTRCDMAQVLPWVGVEDSVVGMEIW